MKKIVYKSALSSLVVGAVLLGFNTSYAQLVPTGNDNFYYQVGGGQDIPMPAYLDTNAVHLSAELNVGLGYNCGVFNPALSIMNSLNSIKNSFENISQSIVANATGAIAEFPMYLIARANPTLYDLLNNGLLGAREDLNISTKSCEVMQNQIGTGQNPYTDWGTIAMGDDWKYHMSLAQSSSQNGWAGDSSSDLNQVKQSVQTDAGKTGIAWVQGVSLHGSKYAGGVSQPIINVIQDTMIAGYNVTLQSGRDMDDTSPPARTSDNDHLVSTWSSPVIAAQWIVNVVGDYKITTYNGGDKGATPGVGLLPQTQSLTQTITQNLTDLVTGASSITISNLQAVSAPRVIINEAVINAIRAETPVMQSILIGKLAQQAATAKVIDEALLARQLLQAGSQVPAIYGNQPAQADINAALKKLDGSINDLLFDVRVNKELVSSTVSSLLENSHSEAVGRSLINPSQSSTPLADGAIPTNNQGGA